MLQFAARDLDDVQTRCAIWCNLIIFSIKSQIAVVLLEAYAI